MPVLFLKVKWKNIAWAIKRLNNIATEAAKMLRRKNLIEGRKPNYYISANVAAILDNKAQYSRNKGLEKEMLFTFIIKHIENHGSASREELDELLTDKLPDYMDYDQRKRKIGNLLQELKKGKIENIGSRTKPKWVLR